MNILPEENRLAEVSSNIWGTKFKILGLNFDHLPPSLGQVFANFLLLYFKCRTPGYIYKTIVNTSFRPFTCCDFLEIQLAY